MTGELPSGTPSEGAAAAQTNKKKQWWRTVLPWVVTLALLAYLFSTVDVEAVGEAFRSARLDWLLPIWLGVVVLVFWADTFCLSVLFSRLNAPISFAELLPVKGASYFLNIVNYNAAAVAIAYVVRRKTGVPFWETTSSMLLLNVVDLIVLNIYVAAGLVLASGVLEPTQQSALIAVSGGLFALYFGSMIYWNAGFDFFVLGRLRSWSIFAAFRNATVQSHAVFVLMRFLFILLYVGLQYVSLHLFGVKVPLGELMMYNAIITLIGTLPISVSGLGTTQVAMLEFYGDYGTDAQILAYSTAMIVMFAASRAAIGYWFLPRLSRELGRDPRTLGQESPPQ